MERETETEIKYFIKEKNGNGKFIQKKKNGIVNTRIQKKKKKIQKDKNGSRKNKKQ
jgi:hypothetical protein